MEIKPEPNLPPALLQDAAAGKLVPFVGAGASRLAGCIGWDELAEKALTFLAKEKVLSYAALQHICQQPFRTQLSIAQRIATTKNVSIPYSLFLNCNIANKDGVRLYSAISRMGRRFVTTNYDQWLDYDFSEPPAPVLDGPGKEPDLRHKEREVIYRKADLEIGKFRDNTVMHLHGSIRDQDSMVLSTDEYLGRYASDRLGGPENRLLTFLDHLFANHAVLFIGYGMEEPEILEFLLLKHAQYQTQPKPERRYVLAPFFSFEAELAAHLRDYWRRFGVEIIPFLRDHNDYYQLIDVAEHIATRLPARSATKLHRLTEMERLLDE